MSDADDPHLVPLRFEAGADFLIRGDFPQVIHDLAESRIVVPEDLGNVGMLVDPHEEVRARARRAIASGAPLPPVPDDPVAAREKLAETFEPFVRAFSAATVAPQVTRIDRSDEDREQIQRLTAALDEQRVLLSAAAHPSPPRGDRKSFFSRCGSRAGGFSASM